MAAACAEFVGADHLIYLTDVAGVLDGENVISAISCEEVEALVQARVVSGGMVLNLKPPSAPWKVASGKFTS